jgi:hypothetical protein
MNFDIGQTRRLLVAHRAHGPDIRRGVSRENAGALRPSARPAQRIQPAMAVIAQGVTVEAVQAATAIALLVPETMRVMRG